MQSNASCPVCGVTKNVKLCSRCRLVGYCSTEHQKEHWKAHKGICKFPVPPFAAFCVQDDPGSISGRVAVATNDFVQGATILDELPLFHCNMPRRFIDTVEEKKEKKEEEVKKEEEKKEEKNEEEKMEGEEKKEEKKKEDSKEEEEDETVDSLRDSCVACGRAIVTSTKNVKRKKDDNESKPKTSENSKNKCSKCHWPVCSVKCEKAAIHADNECPLLAKSGSVFFLEKDRREKILRSRAFAVHNNDPTTRVQILRCVPYQTLEKQEEVVTIDTEIRKWGQNSKDDCDENGKISAEWLKLLDQGEKDRFLAQLNAISRLVGFSFPLDPQHEVKSEHLCIYPTATFFENACRTNCVWTVGPPPEYRIRVRAAIPIKKGERLTVDRYAHLTAYVGTRERQQIFRRRFKRPCKCSLCMDPTEFGTFQSGIVCPKCTWTLKNKQIEKNQEDNKKDNKDKDKEKDEEGQEEQEKESQEEEEQEQKKKPEKKEVEEINIGYLLPADPLDVSRLSKLKCSLCDHVEPYSRAIAQKLLQIFEPFGSAASDSLKSVLIRWEVDKVMSDERLKFLHENHWIIQKGIRTDFAINGIPKAAEFRDYMHEYLPELRRVADYHGIVLSILNRTHPGLHEERVRVMVLLGDILFWMANDTVEKVGPQNLTRDEALEVNVSLSNVIKYWTECQLYWDGTPTLVTTPAALGDRIEKDDPPNLVDRLNAARKLLDHTNAKLVEFRKAAEREDEDAKIEDWEFSYRKKKA